MKAKRVWAALLIAAFASPLAGTAAAQEAPPINVDPSVSDVGHVDPNPNPTQRRQELNRSSEQACFDYTDGGETFTACTTTASEDDAPFARGSAPAERADGFPVPDLCLRLFQGTIGNRKQECAVQPTMLTITNDGEIVGELFYNTYQWTLTVDTYNYVSSVFVVEPWVSWGQGAGWTVHAAHDQMGWGCGDTCEVTESSFEGGLATAGSVHSGTAYYQVSVAPGAIETAWTGTWDFWFTRGAVTSTTSYPPESHVRCDDALPGSTVAGCVLDDYVGYIDVKAIDAPTYRSHVNWAQGSGLPGGQQNPLHRLTDPFLVAANRAESCPTGVSWLPRPPGFSCDEYPFASTYEGAVTGGGEARTFDWCQVTLPNPPSDGPIGYSICMVDAVDNSTGGAQLGTEYREQRILDGDPFWLDVAYPS